MVRLRLPSIGSRIKNILIELKRKKLDGLLVSSPANISYLTKYASRDSYFLISKKCNVYFTDSRYLGEAKLRLKNISLIEKINGAFSKTIANACRKLKLKHLGFEERHLTYAEFKKIKKDLGTGVAFVNTHNLIENLRAIKDSEELDKIEKATQITIKALRFISKFITVGRREAEIAAELERFIRYEGGRASAFEIIVASGPNSSFPHHITSERKIRNNEPVLIDMGVDFQGYKSDLTRVFFLGKISSLVTRVYDIVLNAQREAMGKIKPGVLISKIDLTARQYISKNGYAGFFCHNLGHGIGLEVHEAPTLSSREHQRIKQGMIFTVEPGIYLTGKFGIRLEDMVLVTAKGHEVLSGTLHK